MISEFTAKLACCTAMAEFCECERIIYDQNILKFGIRFANQATNYSRVFPINYCPFCGTKLSEE